MNVKNSKEMLIPSKNESDIHKEWLLAKPDHMKADKDDRITNKGLGEKTTRKFKNHQVDIIKFCLPKVVS